ncbi:hypothetical protein NL676_029613 [Syzygium grande]|nr:hypothetical protein NL676_029613 [Syzygium grande]
MSTWSNHLITNYTQVLYVHLLAVADGARRPRDPAGGGRRQQPEERGRERGAEAEAAAEPRPVGPGTRLLSPAEREARVTEADLARLVALTIEMVGILGRTFSGPEGDRVDGQDAIAFLAKLAEKGKCAGEMVDNGVIPALMKHLQAPPPEEGDKCDEFRQRELKKLSAFAWRLHAEKPEHRQLIVDTGALSHLLNLLKRYKAGSSGQFVNGLIRWAAEAIAKLVQGDSIASILVRKGGGIPVLVRFLEANDLRVQGAAAAVLYSLASYYEEDANEVVTFREAAKKILDCRALPSIVLLLKSDNAEIRRGAVSLLRVLVFSSPEIKKDVLDAGALQPIIRLLSSSCVLSQQKAARLVGLFAAANSVCKAIVRRGAVRPLIKMLQSPELQVREVSASTLCTLAQNSGAQVVIAHEGGLPALLRLLDSESESLQDVAARALHSLLKNEDNVSDFITIGGFRKLQRGEFTGQATKKHVKRAVKRLEEKIQGGVFEHLLDLMHKSSGIIQGRVAVALAHLSHPTNQQMTFINNNGLKLVLGLFDSSCPEEQVDGALALFKLANKGMIFSPLDADSPAPAPRVYLSKQYVNNAMQSDVTFLVESGEFYAYRSCLSASSDAFRAMLYGGYQERDATRIKIPNIRRVIFELMMRFMYSESVEVTPDNALELLKAADQYLIEGLRRLCERAIAQELSMETVGKFVNIKGRIVI